MRKSPYPYLSSRWQSEGLYTNGIWQKRTAWLFASWIPAVGIWLRQIAGMTVLCIFLAACGKQQPVAFNTYGVQKGAGSTGVHTVLPGDTVYKIANNYQLPMREIITLNHIEAPYNLKAGFRMKLPPPNEHEVRQGDTVTSIARLYEVSPNRLVSLNNLSSPYLLRIGAKIRLPSPSAGRAVAQQASFVGNADDVAQSAGIEPVQRENIRQASINNDVRQQPAVTPERKPRVQQASMTRAKIPDVTPQMSGKGKFMRPVDGKVISTYGPKDGGLYNDGINIKAVRGAPVRAAENGVVVYTGDDLEGYGNLVLVRHDNKMMSAYAHLEKTLVKRGATVTRGQSIGTVGSTGQVDSPQLHFEIRRGTTPLDPLKYL